jgi:hypothetical protein
MPRHGALLISTRGKSIPADVLAKHGNPQKSLAHAAA